MKLLLVFPSKGRPENIQKYSIPLAEKLGEDYKIFIEPEETETYKFDNQIILPENKMGLNRSVKFADNYALENGYDLIFKIDDDVKSIGEIEKDLGLIKKAFRNKKIGAVCFPYSFEWYAKSKKLFTRLNKRMQTCYIIRAGLYQSTEKISVFEDFYQFLMLRQNGYNTLYCPKHMIDLAKMVGEGKGGLQLYSRDREKAEKAIRHFQSIDSSIKMIEKPDKKWKVEPKFTSKLYRSVAI
jgi:hypothetical protein